MKNNLYSLLLLPLQKTDPFAIDWTYPNSLEPYHKSVINLNESVIVELTATVARSKELAALFSTQVGRFNTHRFIPYETLYEYMETFFESIMRLYDTYTDSVLFYKNAKLNFSHLDGFEKIHQLHAEINDDINAESEDLTKTVEYIWQTLDIITDTVKITKFDVKSNDCILDACLKFATTFEKNPQNLTIISEYLEQRFNNYVNKDFSDGFIQYATKARLLKSEFISILTTQALYDTEPTPPNPHVPYIPTYNGP